MLRRVNKSVPVQAAKPHELGVFQTRDESKHPALRRVSHFGLKANKIIECLLLIFLPELDDRVRPLARAWIFQSDRAHRTKSQCLFSSIGHFLNRHATFEGNKALKAVGGHAFGG